VSVVEVKDVEIPQGMQRSMAGQAQAERERRAKIISAEGEYQASQRLHDAAERLESPTALQLRLFQTLTEIASENNSTVILPVPIDLFRPYLGDSNGSDDGRARQARAARLGEEEEAERLYEEAVGQARSEQQAMQDLDPEGPNGHTPEPMQDATNLGEEQHPPSDEDPTRTGGS
jgi:regulator of protease activity HflC (stomatin/prohibitin superfamily)